MYIRLTTWLATAALYLGFSIVMGILIRKGWARSRSDWDVALMLLHGFGLFLPTSILVMGSTGSPLALRLLVTLSGVLLLGLAAKQPDWLPSALCQIHFLYRYFAAAMLLACLWGFSLALTAHAISALIIGICAIVAGTASLSAPRRAA
jgi:hypothetical protein